MSPYLGMYRDSGRIVVHLSKSQPPPTELPYELRSHVSPDDWASRVYAIKSLAFRYYKPLFERIWLGVAFLAVIVLPLGLYQIVLASMPKKHRRDHFYEARLIGTAILVGTIMLFWLPLVIWRTVRSRRMSTMLKQWAEADRASKGPNEFVPIWKVKCPTIFKSSCVLSITTPPYLQPSLFHPDAYLPQFINAPRDAGVAYYYPYGPNTYGRPKAGAVGNLPPYDHGVVGVQRFDDVKV